MQTTPAVFSFHTTCTLYLRNPSSINRAAGASFRLLWPMFKDGEFAPLAIFAVDLNLALCELPVIF